jgi:hypothetical protein
MTVPSGSCLSHQPQNVLSRWCHRLAKEHLGRWALLPVPLSEVLDVIGELNQHVA